MGHEERRKKGLLKGERFAQHYFRGILFFAMCVFVFGVILMAEMQSKSCRAIAKCFAFFLRETLLEDRKQKGTNGNVRNVRIVTKKKYSRKRARERAGGMAESV